MVREPPKTRHPPGATTMNVEDSTNFSQEDKMRRSIRALLLAFAVAGVFYPVSAMNGKGVVVISRQTGWGYEWNKKSYLSVAHIVNSAVTTTDTILRSNAGEEMVAPKFSFDGKKIAFARNVTRNGVKAVALSVIDADGTNLRDLGYYDMYGGKGTYINSVNWEYIKLDWPKGDWIYYFCGGSGDASQPKDRREVWRVNVNDTTQRYRVCNYGCDVARFDLSANGLYCAQDIYRDVYNFPQGSNGPRLGRFPAHNPDATLWWDDPNTRSVLGSNYCNSALSPSGTVMFHFSGTHNKIDFAFWDHATDKVIDNNQVLGPSSPCTQPPANTGPGGVCYLEIDKWMNLAPHFLLEYTIGCANTDRWVITDCWWNRGWDGPAFCIAVGWKDRAGIMLANIPKTQFTQVDANGAPNPSGQTFWTVFSNCAHLWVDGGPGTEGKYEDTLGKWQDVDPAGTLVDFHSVNKGGQSYELTMVASPRSANIYYTIDGTEPTSSSARYTGPLLYTGGSTKVTIKAKAIAAGMPTGETVTKFVMASSGLQATSTVSHPVRFAAAARSIYTVYDLSGSKIAQGMGLPPKEGLACGTYFVKTCTNGQSVTRRLSVLSGRQAMQPLR